MTKCRRRAAASCSIVRRSAVVVVRFEVIALIVFLGPALLARLPSNPVNGFGFWRGARELTPIAVKNQVRQRIGSQPILRGSSVLDDLHPAACRSPRLAPGDEKAARALRPRQRGTPLQDPGDVAPAFAGGVWAVRPFHVQQPDGAPAEDTSLRHPVQ